MVWPKVRHKLCEWCVLTGIIFLPYQFAFAEGEVIQRNSFEAHFVLGGAVNGWAAPGLEVRLDAESYLETLFISGNGLYQFSYRPEYGSDYQVSVISKPANLTCVVSNPLGSVLSTNLTINVNCSQSGSNLNWDQGNWNEKSWE